MCMEWILLHAPAWCFEAIKFQLHLSFQKTFSKVVGISAWSLRGRTWCNCNCAPQTPIPLPVVTIVYSALHYIQECLLKVGCSCMAIFKPWRQINGHVQSIQFTQASTKVWVKLLLLPENALNSILRPSNYVNWKFEPSPSTTHTLTPSPIHTQNRSKKLRMDLSWHTLGSKILV